MATKEERYDPGFNYDSDPEELNNRSERFSSSPPSSPVDHVYLTGDFIYNDVGSGWRCGGPMADPERKKEEKKDKESEKKDDSTAQDEEEEIRCIYCGDPIEGRPWSGSGFKCHKGQPGMVTDHDQFCEKCARGEPDENPDKLREADEERGLMTCPIHKKGRKAASASNSDPYRVKRKN